MQSLQRSKAAIYFHLRGNWRWGNARHTLIIRLCLAVRDRQTHTDHQTVSGGEGSPDTHWSSDCVWRWGNARHSLIIRLPLIDVLTETNGRTTVCGNRWSDKSRVSASSQYDLSQISNYNPYITFFCVERPRSRCYGRTAALRLIVQPCNKDD
jgi:hypothetical protein